MDAQEFGRWLRSARKTHGLSAEAIAGLVDVTAPAVYNWESGGSEPDKSRFSAIEAAYRLPSGSIAAALSPAPSTGDLIYWIGRWEQSAMHLRRVLLEQEELVELMKEKVTPVKRDKYGKILPQQELPARETILAKDLQTARGEGEGAPKRKRLGGGGRG